MYKLEKYGEIFMTQKIALINDIKTRIPGTRTFWHFLEDTLGANFISTKKWFWRRHLVKFNPDVIIQNAFWGDLKIPKKPIISAYDFYTKLAWLMHYEYSDKKKMSE